MALKPFAMKIISRISTVKMSRSSTARPDIEYVQLTKALYDVSVQHFVTQQTNQLTTSIQHKVTRTYRATIGPRTLSACAALGCATPARHTAARNGIGAAGTNRMALTAERWTATRQTAGRWKRTATAAAIRATAGQTALRCRCRCRSALANAEPG